ncbi:MAG TPA: winged helix-turn-helix domain-containing protein [Pyrinomonadaceae bacterium]|jgi:DNA-binding response OmpR family regulator
MQELSESRVYEFDKFRLNAKSHRLFSRETNELIPLTPKTVELLIILVQSKGRVLTKDELLDTVAIWRRSTTFSATPKRKSNNRVKSSK